VDEGLVRRLLAEQAPGYRRETVERVGEGWDNVTFRLGPPDPRYGALAVRLPRRATAALLLSREQRWLAEATRGIGIPAPVPIFRGRPSGMYPYPWSVVPWAEGRTADEAGLPVGEGRRLAHALRTLHRRAPAGAPVSRFRGVPLTDRATGVEDRLTDLGMAGLIPTWRRALDTPRDGLGVWIHGDLHARNVIVRDGRVVAIIDWGDLTVGDPSTDLAAAWAVLDRPETRGAFLNTYGASATQRVRAVGWAIYLAAVMAASGDPVHVRLGRAVAARIQAGP
jgi:aminoglycoside phosphotransferase (APT) family kinase protein